MRWLEHWEQELILQFLGECETVKMFFSGHECLWMPPNSFSPLKSFLDMDKIGNSLKGEMKSYDSYV